MKLSFKLSAITQVYFRDAQPEAVEVSAYSIITKLLLSAMYLFKLWYGPIIIGFVRIRSFRSVRESESKLLVNWCRAEFPLVFCDVSSGIWQNFSSYSVTSVRWPVTSVRWPVTSIRWTVTSVRWPVTSVRLPVTSVRCPVTSVRWPVTSVRWPVTSVRWPVTPVRCPVTPVR